MYFFHLLYCVNLKPCVQKACGLDETSDLCTLEERSITICTFALCGFANFASIGRDGSFTFFQNNRFVLNNDKEKTKNVDPLLIIVNNLFKTKYIIWWKNPRSENIPVISLDKRKTVKVKKNIYKLIFLMVLKRTNNHKYR